MNHGFNGNPEKGCIADLAKNMLVLGQKQLL